MFGCAQSLRRGNYDKENQYLILYDSNHGKKGYLNAEEKIAPSANVGWRLVWDHTFLPHLLKSKKIDIYHSFKHVSSFKSGTKLIYTIHSAGLMQFPKFFGYTHFCFYGLMNRLMARTATCFIALTAADKEQHAHWSGVANERIKLTCLAADKRFVKIDDEDEKERVRLKYNLPKKFILYVGIPHPIKNVDTLIKAYALARRNYNIDQKLVIVGKANMNNYYLQLLQLIKNLKLEDSVVFPGYIKDDLPAVYNLADLFVFPSLYENFPLPPMEAIACGTPVIASNVGGIPEIYGDAVITIDPTDIRGLAEAICRVLSSDEMRETLRKKGLERAKMFSWERCARETLKIYEEVYKG